MKTLARELIATCFNKAREQAANYTLTQGVKNPSLWRVAHKTDARRVYTVKTLRGATACTCEAYRKDGGCKHQAIVKLHLNAMAKEAARPRTEREYYGR